MRLWIFGINVKTKPMDLKTAIDTLRNLQKSGYLVDITREENEAIDVVIKEVKKEEVFLPNVKYTTTMRPCPQCQP